MEIPRPAPGEEINTGEVTVPRPAATVILLRGGAQALDVLLVQRNPASRFMGGAWVFPGGAVDRAVGDSDGDGEGDAAFRAAALRELREEAGIELSDPAALVQFSRWITPAQVKIRFDTYFFLAPAPDHAEATIDGAEVVDARWYAPAAALEAAAAGELFLVFPTIKHLEQLARFESADALIEYSRGREVRPVEPRVVLGGETARLILPGEPGYDE
jgi:8-oxo-dGTP pyrophosphatase MutT (NUDIX family)